jgi:glycerol-3-phosphate dehydrogenase (NAD(P)+)
MVSDIAFIGGGSFGTALAAMLGRKGLKVNVWDRDAEIVEEINTSRTNKRYLSGIKIPKGVTALFSLEDAIKESRCIVLAVPSHVIRDTCRTIKDMIKDDQIIISIAKGIEVGTKKRLSQVIKDELPANPVVILSGPSHAEEVAMNLPTTVVVTSEDMEYADEVQDLFMTSEFRVYTNEDIVGVEIGGAVKNIIALAAGISDGIGYGDNTKAALMTRGMHEIMRIGTKLGGSTRTFYGLTGMGDLIVTCTSKHSRNRSAGFLIGQGATREEAIEKVGMVVEGIKACKAFYELKEELDVQMPITDQLYKVLFEGKDPKDAVVKLMTRDKKSE